MEGTELWGRLVVNHVGSLELQPSLRTMKMVDFLKGWVSNGLKLFLWPMCREQVGMQPLAQRHRRPMGLVGKVNFETPHWRPGGDGRKEECATLGFNQSSNNSSEKSELLDSIKC